MYRLGVSVNLGHTFWFSHSLNVEIITTQPYCEIKHVALCVCCWIFKDLVVDDQTKSLLNFESVQILLVRKQLIQSRKGTSPHVDAMWGEVKFACLCFCNNFHHLANWCFFLFLVRWWSLLWTGCDFFFVQLLLSLRLCNFFNFLNAGISKNVLQPYLNVLIRFRKSEF